jgi:hypothetical protein
MADIVAKGFWAPQRERLIQERASIRNIDSKAQPARFLCFKIQFHRLFATTFAIGTKRRLFDCPLDGRY